ncbi:MAG: T9SS type A sorting domain-containing protein [Candidatus Marinimicrobia bacterium]|nr:T9SS type A sorting domain-containing protein [Candidatus Neomarinimicrobiota bacterium]
MKFVKVFSIIALIFLIASNMFADGAEWGLRFDGSSGYVDLTNVVPQIVNSDFTWELWVNSRDENGDGVVGHKDIIMCTNEYIVPNSSFQDNHLLWFIGDYQGQVGVNELAFHDGTWHGSGSDIPIDDVEINNYTFSDDQWVHVAFVFTIGNPNNVKLYLNGAEVLNQNTSRSPISVDDPQHILYLGADWDAGDILTDYLEGGVDELRIYSTALSGADIASLAFDNPGDAHSQSNGSLPGGLVGRWSFNDNDFIFLSDQPGDYFYKTSSWGDDPIPDGTLIYPSFPVDVNYYGIVHGGVAQSSYSDHSLPIELAYFKVKKENGNISMVWLTESELNNAGFNIYRSANDTKNFIKINEELIQGKVTSSTPSLYSYTDAEIKSNTIYYYQLEDVSLDGKTTKHEIVQIIIDELPANPEYFSLEKCYPNPFNPSTNIGFKVGSTAKIQITIYDILGNHIKTLTHQSFEPGNYKVTWNATDEANNSVSAGIYIYRMETDQGFAQTSKMILIK